jgi:hypothetical protein
MLAPVTHFLPITLIRRERLLPQPGRVLVRSGQKLSALDVVAEANVNPEFQWLDIARLLGVAPASADRFLQCQAGDQLTHGDVIAGPYGISNRVVRAQKDSKVIMAGDGQVLLDVIGKPYQLKAGIPGDVVELVQDFGAIIETTGALIQAVWGNGLVDYGLLSVLARRPDHLLTTSDLDVSLRGSVVLGGPCKDAEALRMADELPLRGMILSSITVDLLQVASKVRYPIVLIEGFGERPYNPVVYKLLVTNNHREVALNAEAWNPYMGVRPEVVIPLPAPGNTSSPPDTGVFKPEKMVRVLRAPHAGQTGTILSLKGSVVFPAGLHGKAAEVRLDDGKIDVLPLANLELIT